MALTNAERQKRHRQRQAEAAKLGRTQAEGGSLATLFLHYFREMEATNCEMDFPPEASAAGALQELGEALHDYLAEQGIVLGDPDMTPTAAAIVAFAERLAPIPSSADLQARREAERRMRRKRTSTRNAVPTRAA